MTHGFLVKGLIIFLLGGVVGYFVNFFTAGFSSRYLEESALMMTGNGANMLQMAQIMTGAGNIMKERGKKYKDLEMMRRGSEFAEKGIMMEKNGNDLMHRGGEMMETINNE